MTRRTRVAAAAVLGVLALGGCGSASEPSPPTGIDDLVIPSPSLEAGDFVAGIDNPWLPYAVGAQWTYQVTEGAERTTLTVTVLPETRTIQGVTATVVEEVLRDPASGEVLAQTRAAYAQDDDGNVWALGAETTTYDDGRPRAEESWEAGRQGAEAGLAMAAEPRVGDGYGRSYRLGEAAERSLVVDTDGSASVPYGDLLDLVETEDQSAAEPGVLVRRSYALELGLVRALTTSGGDTLVELVSYTPPA
ncbi:hypothetical protein [Nocardioides stalactiti]|uniref:hypothetical protein n=1 Tax=Nocardioides stalactiti TaxID=2755356 RepID=UPI001603DF75|nr:hypothetical protein [Nocardioides stalactiti]